MDVFVYSYKKHIIFPLLVGMISGSLFFILGYNQFDDNSILSNIYMNNKIDSISNGYIIYLLRQRIILLVVFLIAVILVSFKFASLVFNYIVGVYYGLMASALFVEYGYSSYRLLIYTFLLQSILYFIIMYIAGILFSDDQYSKSVIFNKSNIFNYFVKIILIVVLLVLSVGSEIFFLKKF